MFYEKKEKTPDEKLAIAKIQVMMEDAFGILSNSESSPALQSKARYWFYTADCSLWCDMAGTTHDHIKKLYETLQFNYICISYFHFFSFMLDYNISFSIISLPFST